MFIVTDHEGTTLGRAATIADAKAMHEAHYRGRRTDLQYTGLRTDGGRLQQGRAEPVFA